MKSIYDPEVLGLQVVKMMGAEALVFCPYHSDSHPSAEYNFEKGLFHCFGCHTNKTAKELAEDLGGSLVAITEIPDGMLTRKLGDWGWARILSNPLAIHCTYLYERSVDITQIREYEIRDNADGVIFPIKNGFGQIVGAQIRHLSRQPKYMFYGDRQPLWPMEKLKGAKGEIFITEGVFGALRGEGSFVPTFAMMGAGMAAQTGKWLKNLGGVKPIVIMDNDYAGLLAAGKFILLGIPAILAPWRGAPDDWSRAQWDEVVRHSYEYATTDILNIVEASTEPGKMERTLEKFWRKL